MTITEAATLAETTAQALLSSLHAQHISGALGRPIQYGHKFSVTAATGIHYQAILYVGKSGPRLVAEGPAWPVELWQTVSAVVAGSVAVPRPTATPLTAITQKAGSTVIYVDGSYVDAGNHQTVGWAFEVWQQGQPIHQNFGSFDAKHAYGTRNIAGECYAVFAALAWCTITGIHTIECRHDYIGLAHWAEGTWDANTELTRHYISTLEHTPVQITWIKVEAHRGEVGNTRVDAAARQAATNRLAFTETPALLPTTLYST